MVSLENQNDVRPTIEEASQFARDNNITTNKEWNQAAKEGKLPPNMPAKPFLTYSSVWNGWENFLSGKNLKKEIDPKAPKKSRKKRSLKIEKSKVVLNDVLAEKQKSDDSFTATITKKEIKTEVDKLGDVLFIIKEKRFGGNVLTIGIEKRGKKFIKKQLKETSFDIYRLYKYDSEKETYVQSVIQNLSGPYDDNPHHRYVPDIMELIHNLDVQLVQLRESDLN